MDSNRSQHYNFTYEAIPVMFHSQTNQFMKYLEKDGVKFLEFWWDHVGERLPEERLSDFKDVACEITPVDKQTKMAIIRLPVPAAEKEAFYIGLISRPERRFAWVRLPNTSVVCLIRREGEAFPNGTELIELTPSARVVPMGAGPAPDWEAFKQVLLKMVKKG
ncbi:MULTISPECIES: hypothetical protein [Anaerolinea]|uniref:hypothetical protein n=1 Tax=Anaerolinea TaxID=233189 RepID=UPI00260EC395|nr:hypothetical protein [Anaerolinea thermophila]